MKQIRDAHVATNRVHQKWMLDKMSDLVLPKGSKAALGYLDPEDYRRVAGELKRNDLITATPPYGEFYVNCTAPR